MKNFSKGAGLGFIFVFFLICCVCTCCFWFMFASMSNGNINADNLRYEYAYAGGSEDGNTKILLIDIKGVILNEGSNSGFGSLFGEAGSYGYNIQSQLERAAASDDIDGVILVVDSPGGTITGSEAIYDGVEYYKNQTGKPVLAWGSGAMASGAYWASLAADEIHLDTGSIVGSIGVISGQFKYYNNVTTEGSFLGSVTAEDIQTTYITAGKGKDLGNPYREITQEEKELMQSLADNSYDDFVERVSRKRNIPANSIRDNIGAYVYDEELGLENKLIDKISNKNEVIRKMAELRGIDISDVQLVREEMPLSGFWSLFFSATNVFSPKSQNDSVNSEICNYSYKPVAVHGNLANICN